MAIVIVDANTINVTGGTSGSPLLLTHITTLANWPSGTTQATVDSYMTRTANSWTFNIPAGKRIVVGSSSTAGFLDMSNANVVSKGLGGYIHAGPNGTVTGGTYINGKVSGRTTWTFELGGIGNGNDGASNITQSFLSGTGVLSCVGLRIINQYQQPGATSGHTQFSFYAGSGGRFTLPDLELLCEGNVPTYVSFGAVDAGTSTASCKEMRVGAIRISDTNVSVSFGDGGWFGGDNGSTLPKFLTPTTKATIIGLNPLSTATGSWWYNITNKNFEAPDIVFQDAYMDTTKIAMYGYANPAANLCELTRTVTFNVVTPTNTSITQFSAYAKATGTGVEKVNSKYNSTQSQLISIWKGRGTSNAPADAYHYPSWIVDERSVSFLFRHPQYNEVTSTISGEFGPATINGVMAVDSYYTSDQSSFTGIRVSDDTFSITESCSYDVLYDYIKWWQCQSEQMSKANCLSPSGSNLTLTGTKRIVVNPGVTLSAGSKFTYLYANAVDLVDAATAPYLFNASGVLQSTGVLLGDTVLGTQATYTGAGKITAVYASAAGTSTVWQFQEVEIGSSLVVYDASGVTKYFQGEVTTAGTYTLYIPPGVSGTYYYAVEKYGYKREEGNFPANSGGILFYVPDYQEDVGITQTTKATVAAYTTLENYDKLYDYVAYKRLSEAWIKLGQVGTREGTAINFGTYSGRVKSTNPDVLSLSGSAIYLKANGLAGGVKYSTIIATPPATWAGDTVESITGEIEDGNGDSSVTISASGISTFEIWKITDATDPDDYATGTLLGTVGVGKYRFLHADGYKMVIRDTTTNFRVVSEMEKGVYEAALFFGAAVQLAQAAEVSEINIKVDSMQIDLDAIKGTGHVKDKHSLTNIKKKAALAAALSA
jgi:hypothetical protein